MGIKKIKDNNGNNKKKPDLYSLLNNGSFSTLASGEGLNLFMIDTGVLIDLDKSYYRKIHDNGRTSRNGDILVYNHPASLLSLIENKYPLIITRGVMREVRNHREDRKIKVNWMDEISEPTALLAYGLYENSRDFFKECRIDKLSREVSDLHRLNVRLASDMAFKGDYRKGEKDEISETDIEIISLALDLSLCRYKESPIKTINILSTDAHISRTIKHLKEPFDSSNGSNELMSKSFNGYGVRAIPVRGNLASYMSR